LTFNYHPRAPSEERFRKKKAPQVVQEKEYVVYDLRTGASRTLCRTCLGIGRGIPKRAKPRSIFCEEHDNVRRSRITHGGVSISPSFGAGGGYAFSGGIWSQVSQQITTLFSSGRFAKLSKIFALLALSSFVAELTFFILFLDSYSVNALVNSNLFFPESPISSMYYAMGGALAPVIYKAWVTLGVWTTINTDLLLSAIVAHFQN
jgi:hypothetical protein